MNNVVEKIKQRQKSIRESLNSLKSKLTIENIPSFKLSDFAHLDCAIQVHSEILDSEIWLCSDSEMEKQLKQDDPTAITYTVKEILDLMKLNPSPEELRRIHYAKEVFHKSTIINSVVRNES